MRKMVNIVNKVYAIIELHLHVLDTCIFVYMFIIVCINKTMSYLKHATNANNKIPFKSFSNRHLIRMSDIGFTCKKEKPCAMLTATVRPAPGN